MGGMSHVATLHPALLRLPAKRKGIYNQVNGAGGDDEEQTGENELSLVVLDQDDAKSHATSCQKSDHGGLESIHVESLPRPPSSRLTGRSLLTVVCLALVLVVVFGALWCLYSSGQSAERGMPADMYPCGLADTASAVFADMHDGDQKKIVREGMKITITPHGNDQTWSTSAHLCPMHCNASIDFNVPNKPSPPPINLTAVVSILQGPDGAKAAVVFNDNTGKLAPASTPLNAWIQVA